jgi:hypothetical protein
LVRIKAGKPETLIGARLVLPLAETLGLIQSLTFFRVRRQESYLQAERRYRRWRIS